MTINGFKAGRSEFSDYFQDGNGQRFSTKDQDNDTLSSHCASSYGGNSGWWYNGLHYNSPCYESTLMLKTKLR